MIKWIKSLFENKKSEVEPVQESKPQLEIGGEEYTNELLATLKSILTTYDNFERLYFYGSRASGKNRPNSDYDFYIVFSDKADDIFDGLHINNPRISQCPCQAYTRLGTATAFPLPLQSRAC